MSIKCGNHTEKTYHETVTEVRACFAGAGGGEPVRNDVILTDAELMKVVEGVRDMEREGILPRRSRPYGIEDARRELAEYSRPQAVAAAVDELARTTPNEQAAKVAKWDAEARLSPNGNVIPNEYQGSPKQYDYLLSMVQELGEEETYDWSKIFSVRKASAEIDVLKDKVRDARRVALANREPVAVKSEPVRQTVTGQVTQDGIYRNPETGELFKVQVAVHGSGNLYAKQAVMPEPEWNDGAAYEITNIPLTQDELDQLPTERIEWIYKPGLLSKIKPEWKVTREEAIAFGQLYGQCIRCHRTLTNEESIEAAIGPVCRGKLGF